MPEFVLFGGLGRKRGSRGSTCNLYVERFLPSKKNLEAGWTQLLVECDGYSWNDIPIFVTWHELWTDAWMESMASLFLPASPQSPALQKTWGMCSLQLCLRGCCSWHRTGQGIHVPCAQRVCFCQTAPFTIPSTDIDFEHHRFWVECSLQTSCLARSMILDFGGRLKFNAQPFLWIISWFYFALPGPDLRAAHPYLATAEWHGIAVHHCAALYGHEEVPGTIAGGGRLWWLVGEARSKQRLLVDFSWSVCSSFCISFWLAKRTARAEAVVFKFGGCGGYWLDVFVLVCW